MRKIEQGDRSNAVVALRAVINAQNNRAREIISASNFNTMMEPADKKALLDEQKQFYDAEIEKLRSVAGRTTAPSGGTVPAGTPVGPKNADRVPANAPIVAQPASTAPPIAALKPGGVNIMPDGSKWRLVNGQPVQVQ